MDQHTIIGRILMTGGGAIILVLSYFWFRRAKPIFKPQSSDNTLFGIFCGAGVVMVLAGIGVLDHW